MAQRVITQLVSDISGDEITSGGQTITFGFQGVDYTIDLTEKEADKFEKALQPYLDVATKVGRKRAISNFKKATAGDNAAIREWANDAGFKLGDRGRIPGEVKEAYAKAH